MTSYGSLLFLKQLGIESYVTWTYTENRPGYENGHFILVVKDLDRRGELYLIDFGTRISPLSMPVPLHELTEHNQQSQNYQSFYMNNKFVRQGDEILRFTGKVGSQSEPFLFYRVKAVPVVVDIGFEDAKGEFISSKKFPKLPSKKVEEAKQRPGRFWVEHMMIVGFPEGRSCVFRNKEFLYQEEKGGEIKRRNFEDCSQLVAEITKHYPQYGADNIRETIEAIWDVAINV